MTETLLDVISGRVFICTLEHLLHILTARGKGECSCTIQLLCYQCSIVNRVICPGRCGAIRVLYLCYIISCIPTVGLLFQRETRTPRVFQRFLLYLMYRQPTDTMQSWPILNKRHAKQVTMPLGASKYIKAHTYQACASLMSYSLSSCSNRIFTSAFAL